MASTFLAAEEGDLTKLKYFVSEGENINAYDAAYCYPLSIAATHNHREIVEYIIKSKGSDSTITDDISEALVCAIEKGNLDIVNYLIQRYPGLKDTYSFSIESDDPKRAKAIRGTVSVKNDYSSTNYHHNSVYSNETVYTITPLVESVKSGQFEVFKYLIEAGSDAGSVSKQMKWSEVMQSTKILMLLLEIGGASWEKTDFAGVTLWAQAVTSGKLEIIKPLIEKGADVDKLASNDTPLAVAVQYRHFPLVKCLVEAGADLYKVTSGSVKNPLYGAALKDDFQTVKYLVDSGAIYLVHSALFPAVQNRNYEMVKFLIQKGAAVNSTDLDGRTPLIMAVQQRDLKIVTLLVESGANVTQSWKSNVGIPPLEVAVDMQRFDIVKYLVEKGANINHVYQPGVTLFSKAVAISNLRIVIYLMENGVDLDANSRVIEDYAKKNVDFNQYFEGMKTCRKCSRNAKSHANCVPGLASGSNSGKNSVSEPDI